MRVREIMNKAFAIEENLSLKEGARIMSQKGVGSLIIMKKNKITGILTERDVLKNVSNLGQKVKNVMSKNIILIDPNESIEIAADLMAENKIRRLPVVYKDKLIGILTSTDLLANSDSLADNFLFD